MRDRRHSCADTCPRKNALIHSPLMPGSGPKKAKIMLVGEAPGQNEDREGVPFIGKSGILLTESLESVGLSRDDIYLTNAVKCGTPEENTQPKAKDLKACRHFLEKEIKAVKPNVIGVLGGVALEAVLKRKGITKIQNNVFISEEFGIKVVPVIHPAFVLRNPGEYSQFLKGIGIIATESTDKQLVDTDKHKTSHVDADTPKKIDRVLDAIDAADYFVFDLETTSLEIMRAQIICVALSWKPGIGATIKWDAFSKSQRKRMCNLLLSKKMKIGHNLKYDISVFLANHVKVRGPFFDTLLAISLINENIKEKTLEAMTLRYTDLGEYWTPLEEEKERIRKEKKIKKTEVTYDMIPYKTLQKYAQCDADVTCRLYKTFKKELQRQELEEFMQKYSIPTMLMLLEMEFKGILVDRAKLAALIAEYRKRETAAANLVLEEKVVAKYEKVRIKRAGAKYAKHWEEAKTLKTRFPDVDEYIATRIKDKDWKFNPRSTPQLRDILFKDILKLTPTKFSPETKEPSTDEEVLTELAAQGIGIAQRIIDHRKLSKYISTYLVSTYEKSEYDGRVHASYTQHRAVTGRLCVDKDTLLDTDHGKIKIKDIDLLTHPGIRVKSHTGKWRKIRNKYYKGLEQMYRVTLETGDSIICTGGHRFLTPTGWVRLENASKDSYVRVLSTRTLGRVEAATKNIENVKICAITPVGIREVWDIEVETDHSYTAQGFINHNSCSDPNMQNIPRDAYDFKECFLADPGYTFVKADLAQAEFRCWAHYANDTDMISDIESGLDIHRYTASEIFGVTEDEVTKDQRTAAKNCVFGLMYGRGQKAISIQYGIAVEEAKAIRELFFSRYPKAANWLSRQKAYVREFKHVKTWMGRIRRLPDIDSENPGIQAEAERQATNSPIQGLASNMNDYYMVNTLKRARKQKIKCYPAVTQHDAQIYQVWEPHVDRMVKTMLYVVKNSFPDFRCKMVLDFEIGSTLGTLKEVGDGEEEEG